MRRGKQSSPRIMNRYKLLFLIRNNNCIVFLVYYSFFNYFFIVNCSIQSHLKLLRYWNNLITIQIKNDLLTHSPLLKRKKCNHLKYQIKYKLVFKRLSVISRIAPQKVKPIFIIQSIYIDIHRVLCCPSFYGASKTPTGGQRHPTAWRFFVPFSQSQDFSWLCFGL